MDAWRFAGSGRHRPLVSLLAGLALSACGGGSGGEPGGGGGGGGGGNSSPPLPPSVDYTGVSTQAELGEANAARFAATLIDGLVLVEQLAQSIIREPGLVPGSVNVTISGSEGGTARIRGFNSGPGTGWFEIDYLAFQQDGVRLDGREVQTLIEATTPDTAHVRLSYYGLRIQSAEGRFEATGSLTRRESRFSAMLDRNEVDMLFVDLDSGEVQRVGPWQYIIDLNSGYPNYVAIQSSVYSALHGFANIAVTAPLAFGIEDGNSIDPGPSRGTVRFQGANGSGFDLVALNWYFGALQFTDGQGRVSTRRIAWRDDYDQIEPSAGVPLAAAGPALTGEIFQRMDLDGRMAEHTGHQGIRYSWRFVALPPGSHAELQDAQSPTPWFVPDRFGSYLIEQVVEDGVGQNTDYVRAFAAATGPNMSHDTFLPSAYAYGGPDLRVSLGEPVVVDGRRAALRTILRNDSVHLGADDTFHQASLEPPVGTVIPQQRGGRVVIAAVVPPGLEWNDADVQVFVDTPFWTHRPLPFFDGTGRMMRPTDVVLADFNGDGRKEIVISRLIPDPDDPHGGQAAAMLTVIPVASDGRFGEPSEFTLPFAGALGLADLNGDGRLDVALRGPTDIGIFFQQANGTLLPGPRFALDACWFTRGEHAGALHIGDVTGNGRLDVAAVSGCPPSPDSEKTTLLTLMQDEAGNYSKVETATESVLLAQMRAADLNGDGRLDLVYFQGFIGAGGIQVAYGQPDGSFQFEFIELGRDVSSPAVADFNSDGRSDIAVLADGEIHVLLQRDGGGFDQFAYPGSDTIASDGLFAGDLDGDGRIDLVQLTQASVNAYESDLRVFMRKPDGSFEPPSPMHFLTKDASAGSRLLIEDLTGDGQAEVLAVRTNFRFGANSPYSATLELTLQRP